MHLPQESPASIHHPQFHPAVSDYSVSMRLARHHECHEWRKGLPCSRMVISSGSADRQMGSRLVLADVAGQTASWRWPDCPYLRSRCSNEARLSYRQPRRHGRDLLPELRLAISMPCVLGSLLIENATRAQMTLVRVRPHQPSQPALCPDLDRMD